MITLNIKGEDYKVKFGYNSFCDTDLMERTQQMMSIFQTTETDNNETLLKIKDLFVVVRELLFVGFKKLSPVESVQEVGNLLDEYLEEKVEGEKRGLIQLFSLLAEELMNEGFFGNLMQEMTEAAEEAEKKLKKK